MGVEQPASLGGDSCMFASFNRPQNLVDSEGRTREGVRAPFPPFPFFNPPAGLLKGHSEKGFSPVLVTKSRDSDVVDPIYLLLQHPRSHWGHAVSVYVVHPHLDGGRHGRGRERGR